eukprot:5624007-Heterocapsa_arctica.AAC.1
MSRGAGRPEPRAGEASQAGHRSGRMGEGEGTGKTLSAQQGAKTQSPSHRPGRAPSEGKFPEKEKASRRPFAANGHPLAVTLA